MATPTLVGHRVADGERLVQALADDGLEILAAFWVPARGGMDRRFVIASPLVDEDGSLPAYRRIDRVIRALPDLSIALTDVTAVGTDDPIVQELRRGTPANFAPNHFEVTLPGYVYAPYLEEGADDVPVYVQRLTPRGRKVERAAD